MVPRSRHKAFSFSQGNRASASKQTMRGSDSGKSCGSSEGSGDVPRLQLPPLEIALLGSERVGKSCLANQFQFGAFLDAYIPTMPEDFNWIEYDTEEGTIMVKIIDLSGSREFLGQRKLYMSSCDAFLVVFAVDDAGSWEEAKEIWTEIRASNTKRAPIKLVATKTDRFPSEEDWAVPRDDVRGFVSANRAPFAELCSKDTDSVAAVFRQLLSAARNVGLSEHLTMRRQSSPAIIRSARGSIHQISKDEMARLEAAAAAAEARDRDSDSPNVFSKARQYISTIFHHH